MAVNILIAQAAAQAGRCECIRRLTGGALLRARPVLKQQRSDITGTSLGSPITSRFIAPQTPRGDAHPGGSAGSIQKPAG